MLFVAEIGSNHKGSKSLAYEMVRRAKMSGADVAKFQLGHKPGTLYDNNQMRYAPTEWVLEIKDWCEKFEIDFLASIFSYEGLEAARKVNMKYYKYASRRAFNTHSDVSYDSLLEEMLKDGVPIFVAGPDAFVDRENKDLIRPISCTAKYPTYPAEANIPPRFGSGTFWGYSSHVHGFADALIALSRGAQYIEKHVTLDKTEESIKDNAFSLTFDEFANMVNVGREMEMILGADKRLQRQT